MPNRKKAAPPGSRESRKSPGAHNEEPPGAREARRAEEEGALELTPENQPYTPADGEPESVLPLGFQSTEDPAIWTTGQPDVVHSGLSAHEQEVAWDRDDPQARVPGREADRLGAGFDPNDLGDETGDASSPRPDANVAAENGEEAGITYQDSEELGTTDKVAGRDEHRWELDPASSEDYGERQEERRGDPGGRSA